MLTLTGWKTSDFSRRLGSSCQDQRCSRQPTATLTPTIAARRAETSIPLFNENRYKHKASYVIRRGRVLSKRGLRHSVALLRHKLLLENLTVAQTIKRFHAFHAITNDYRVHKSLPLESVLSRIDLHFQISNRNCSCIHHCPNACYMPRSCHHPRLDHPNNILREKL